MAGRIKAFVSLGGNLLRAVPDQKDMEEAWASQELTVMVSTKLNRSHLFPGKEAWILPCLTRTEMDMQATGNQTVTTEDSFSHISASVGKRTPASKHLKSELAIVTGIAKAVLEANPKLRWGEWTADYGLVRDLIEATYPDDFKDYNARMFEPGGFYRGNDAHDRVWNTEEKKAVFTAPHRLNAISFEDEPGRFRLITMRSNDQFNTTIYSNDDRFRGVRGSRMVLFMGEADMARHGLRQGDVVALRTSSDDGVERRVDGLQIVPYDVPAGCIAGYYPECNPLIPLWHHAKESKAPAAKSIDVLLERSVAAAAP